VPTANQDQARKGIREKGGGEKKGVLRGKETNAPVGSGAGLPEISTTCERGGKGGGKKKIRTMLAGGGLQRRVDVCGGAAEGAGKEEKKKKGKRSSPFLAGERREKERKKSIFTAIPLTNLTALSTRSFVYVHLMKKRTRGKKKKRKTDYRQFRWFNTHFSFGRCRAQAKGGGEKEEGKKGTWRHFRRCPPPQIDSRPSHITVAGTRIPGESGKKKRKGEKKKGLKMAAAAFEKLTEADPQNPIAGTT